MDKIAQEAHDAWFKDKDAKTYCEKYTEWIEAHQAQVVRAEWVADRPGLGNTDIRIWFNKAAFDWKSGITYDHRNGVTLIVKKNYGEFIIATIADPHPHNWLPENFLNHGVTWYQIDGFPHGEYTPICN